MKKSIVLVLVLACIISLFIGCREQSKYQSTEVKNVSISISDVSTTGATIVIKDTNDIPYVYGEWYKIEIEKDGKWYAVETIISNYGFDELGYIPNDNGEVKFTVDWEWLYGKLPFGKYRILKQVDSQYISVEFNLE